MTMTLEGIRILTSAHQYPGPYCTMLLADLGADVLKVEQPGVGDSVRQFPPVFESINRNKRSITLNLRNPKGREIFFKLIRGQDVFLEGFRPGVSKRLHIDYETLRRINRKLVYCSISGYGQNGPNRDFAGHDLDYQAMAGMLSCFLDKEGVPIYGGLSLGDISAGMFAVIGILASLIARERTGQGQYIDCSIFDGLLSWMSVRLGFFFATGETKWISDAGYGIFRTSDDKYITLGIAHEDWFWNRLCDELGLKELKGLGTIERRKRRNELVQSIEAILCTKTRDEWVRIFREADVPVSPVNEFEEISDNPQVQERGMIQEMELSNGRRLKQVSFPVKFSSTPTRMRMPPPALGEHTEHVLMELGYARKQIEHLRKEGVI